MELLGLFRRASLEVSVPRAQSKGEAGGQITWVISANVGVWGFNLDGMWGLWTKEWNIWHFYKTVPAVYIHKLGSSHVSRFTLVLEELHGHRPGNLLLIRSQWAGQNRALPRRPVLFVSVSCDSPWGWSSLLKIAIHHGENFPSEKKIW